VGVDSGCPGRRAVGGDRECSAASRRRCGCCWVGWGSPRPTRRPGPAITDLVVDAEVEHLGAAELYVLSPQMCDVVAAAAQSLTFEDLSLLTADDLPRPGRDRGAASPRAGAGHDGDLADDRVYTWQAGGRALHPSPETGLGFAPGVRVSSYQDTHGPVQPDSFWQMAAQAAATGWPLPPWLLDAIRCQPYEFVPTPEQRAALQEYIARARRAGDRGRARAGELGMDEDRVFGEYQPGQETEDHDGRFTERFLYAFWRLCEQRIACVTDAPVSHSAQVLAERAQVPPAVRVVDIRGGAGVGERTGDAGREWQHRWVVRMHKVRQWYPSEQRHKVIYRGPYLKGPAGKPLLGGEVVHGLTR
jgi:hypothetical protein